MEILPKFSAHLSDIWTSILYSTILWLLTLNVLDGYRWLSVKSYNGLKKSDDCDQLTGLTSKQRVLCRRNFEVMNGVTFGAILAVNECQHQFRNKRWNCSIDLDDFRVGARLNVGAGTREAAFVKAISSAGLAYGVTRACNTGRLTGCGCDRSVNDEAPSAKGFQWAGCSDNIPFGVAFARTFVDAGERVSKEDDKKRSNSNSASMLLANQHNSNAGCKSVSNTMKVRCKCHGVSGSCELKTCWKSLPNIRQVGQALHESYNSAVEVDYVRVSETLRQLVPKANPGNRYHHRYKRTNIVATNLVFLQSSPDYCEPDPKTSWPGTRGRSCNQTSRGTDGCDDMCCGRGFVIKRRTVIDKCKCKFTWCCFVKCQKCKQTTQEQHCL